MLQLRKTLSKIEGNYMGHIPRKRVKGTKKGLLNQTPALVKEARKMSKCGLKWQKGNRILDFKVFIRKRVTPALPFLHLIG